MVTRAHSVEETSATFACQKPPPSLPPRGNIMYPPCNYKACTMRTGACQFPDPPRGLVENRAGDYRAERSKLTRGDGRRRYPSTDSFEWTSVWKKDWLAEGGREEALLEKFKRTMIRPAESYRGSGKFFRNFLSSDEVSTNVILRYFFFFLKKIFILLKNIGWVLSRDNFSKRVFGNFYFGME